MNANRKLSMVMSGFLGAGLLITALFFGFQPVAPVSGQLSSGSGEIPGFENRHNWGLSSSMGNLRRYEKLQAQLAAPPVITGFGDLHKYENQLEALSEARADPAGMGDVHRFEATR